MNNRQNQLLAAAADVETHFQPSLRRSLSAGMRPPARRLLPLLNAPNESLGGSQPRPDGVEVPEDEVEDGNNVMMASVVFAAQEKGEASSSLSGLTNESLILLGEFGEFDGSGTQDGAKESGIRWKLFENPIYKDSVSSSRESLSR